MTNYLTNCEYSINRAKNDSIREKLESDFQVVQDVPDYSGYHIDFRVILKTNKIKEYSDLGQLGLDQYVGIHKLIPSALVMYRLVCTFGKELNIEYGDSYKSVWSTQLRHKETGIIINIYDFKGAFSINFVMDSMYSEEDYSKVGKLFLKLISDKNFTHTYDQTVAGSVA